MADLFCVYCGHSLRNGIEGDLLEVCPSCSNVVVSSEELISGKRPAPRVRSLPEVHALPEVMALPEVLGLPEVEIPSWMSQSVFPPPVIQPLAGLEPPTEVVKPLERKQELPKRPERETKPESVRQQQPVETNDPWSEVPGTMTFELPPGRQADLPPPSLPPQLPPRREEGATPRQQGSQGRGAFPTGRPKAGQWPRHPGEPGQQEKGAKRWVPYATILAFILSFGGPASPIGRLIGAGFLAAVVAAGYATYASTKGKDMGESFFRTFSIAIVVIAFLMRN
jgi:hypothetical protein